MQTIEAVPHTKIEKIRRFVSEWLVNGDVEASETMGKIAAVLIEPDPIVPNDQVIAEMLERIRMTEQSERSADQQVERLQAELQNLRSQRCGQAEAWVAVFKTIAECIPGAFDADGKAVDQACTAIRQLATEAGRKAEARIDVIGQNGNTGEHYEELAELAIQQGGKPVEELPYGLTWGQAPEWATALIQSQCGTTVLWSEFLEGQPSVQIIRTGDGDETPKFSGNRIDLREPHAWTLIATRPAPAERRDATQG